jgi:hypothetical protein
VAAAAVDPVAWAARATRVAQRSGSTSHHERQWLRQWSPTPGPGNTGVGRRAGRRPPWVAITQAGTLAAQGSGRQLRREVQPAPLVRWQHALYTSLDRPPDIAYRRWLTVHTTPGP